MACNQPQAHPDRCGCEPEAPIGYVSGERFNAEHERLRDCRKERDALRAELSAIKGQPMASPGCTKPGCFPYCDCGGIDSTPAPPVVAEAEPYQVPIELHGVAEQIARGAGFWRSCSGCYETEDGHPMGNYVSSHVLQCDLGAGCSECGGLGAVWDNIDYDEMYESQEEPEDVPPASGAVPVPRELLERVCRDDGASNVMAIEELRALLAKGV